MNDQRWQQFVQLAQEQFMVQQNITKDILVQTIDGPVKQGTIDILIFEKDNQSYKLERENKPLILEKKMHYAKRATDVAKVDYVVSATEFTHKLRVFKENDAGDWEEIGTESLGI